MPLNKSKSTEKIVISRREPEEPLDYLAKNFRRRKLIVKAWKAILYSRMHSIHTQHAMKLSSAYHTRRLLHLSLSSWHYFVHQVLPSERNGHFA